MDLAYVLSAQLGALEHVLSSMKHVLLLYSSMHQRSENKAAQQ